MIQAEIAAPDTDASLTIAEVASDAGVA